MAFTDLTARLNLNTSGFTRGMRNAIGNMNQFASRLEATARRNANASEEMGEKWEEFGKKIHSVGLGLKDIARIVSGILISQAFYRGANAIKDATSELWEFNRALDYAQVTYSALFNSSDLATSFLDVLQEYSINTMFGFQDLEGMAKKLLAYGIEYKNLMYIIQGLTNIGTLSGDSAGLERLAIAIGQIKAKGTLKAEEVRQLTNAYVPVQDILKTKLGYTEEQIAEGIGNLGIKADDAIDAIVEYANEKFSGAANAAMYTVDGLNQKISDSAKVLGNTLTQPIVDAYKSVAFQIAEWLAKLTEIAKQSGAGGVFEYLVPDEELQYIIRAFIASVINGFYRLIGVLKELAPYFSAAFQGLLIGLTTIRTVLNFVVSAFVALHQVLISDTPAINLFTAAIKYATAALVIFFAYTKLRALITALGVAFRWVAAQAALMASAVVRSLSAMALSVARNPVILFVLALTGAMAALTKTTNKSTSIFSKFMNALSGRSLGGKTANDILQPEDNDLTEETDKSQQFWNSMSDGADDATSAVDKTTDSLKNATKAARGLLSFDEVFKLNDPTDSTNTLDDTSLDDLEDLDLTGLTSDFEVPDLGNFANDFVDTLYNELWKSMKTMFSGAAYGGLIGGLVGFAIGGLVTRTMPGAMAGAKLGAKIGTVVGAGLATFWTGAYKDMEDSIRKIAIGGGAGALAGGIAGLVIGAFATRNADAAFAAARIGAGIGGMIGLGLGAFWAGATEEMSNSIEGLLVGSGVGMLTGALVGLVIGAFATRTLEGALAGAQFGAKVGTLIGGALGSFWGAASTEMKESMLTFLESFQVAATGMLIGGIVGMLIGAFVTRTPEGAAAGAKIGSALGALLVGATQPVFAAGEEAVTTGLSNMFSGIQGASMGAFIGGFAGMIIGALVGAFAGAGIGALPGAKIGAMLGTAIGALGGYVYDKLNEAGIVESVAQWFSELGEKITEWWDSLWDVTTWKEAWLSVKEWFVKLGTDIQAWFTEKKQNIKTWWENLWVVKSWKAAWTLVKIWFDNFKEKVKAWFIEKKESVKTWWHNLWNPSNWKSAWSIISTWFNNLKTSISSWFSGLKSSIASWWSGLWGGLSASVSGTSGVSGSISMRGHATGGIFNKEHIARFAEGNKAEAVIPLENESAMMPFVNAIANGLTQSLAPTLASIGGGGANQQQPLYVGTLIADERGLKELNRRMQVIQIKEGQRRA